MQSSMEPIAKIPVISYVGNYGNGDENLCSIHPPDGNNYQYDSDMNDQNTTIGTYREARIQDVGGEGATEPQEIANPAEDEVVVQPSNFEQEIINQDSEIRHDTTMDQTHWYSLRSSRSDWRRRFGQPINNKDNLKNWQRGSSERHERIKPITRQRGVEPSKV